MMNTNEKRRRLRSVVAGVAVGALGLTGSLLVLGQSAGATATTAPATATATDVDPTEETWADFDQCLVDEGVLTEEDLDAMYSETYDDEFLDGEIFDEEFFDDEAATEWDDSIPTVSVQQVDQLNFFEFGSGDGTVTITKVGDDIQVSSDGDVLHDSFDLSDLDVFADDELFDGFSDEELEAEIAAWDAALENCEHLVPADFGDLLDGEGIDGWEDESIEDEGHLEGEGS